MRQRKRIEKLNRKGSKGLLLNGKKIERDVIERSTTGNVLPEN